jgi:hypothetical protein
VHKPLLRLRHIRHGQKYQAREGQQPVAALSGERSSRLRASSPESGADTEGTEQLRERFDLVGRAGEF